jgi:hypothetical protein
MTARPYVHLVSIQQPDAVERDEVLALRLSEGWKIATSYIVEEGNVTRLAFLLTPPTRSFREHVLLVALAVSISSFVALSLLVAR